MLDGVLDTFDSVTPSYQSAHTVYEVQSWFKKMNFKDIRIASWENIIEENKLNKIFNFKLYFFYYLATVQDLLL